MNNKEYEVVIKVLTEKIEELEIKLLIKNHEVERLNKELETRPKIEPEEVEKR